MSGCVTKRPDDRHRARMTFDPPLRGRSETIERDAGWLVQKVSRDRSPAKIAAQTCGPDWCEAVIEGGVPGETYLVTAQAETSEGRVIKRAFVLRIDA